jgi:hypothetical protein
MIERYRRTVDEGIGCTKGFPVGIVRSRLVVKKGLFRCKLFVNVKSRFVLDVLSNHILKRFGLVLESEALIAFDQMDKVVTAVRLYLAREIDTIGLFRERNTGKGADRSFDT